MEKEPIEGVPSPAFPWRPTRRLSLKAGWEGSLHGVTLGHRMHVAIGKLPVLPWRRRLLVSGAASLCCLSQGFSLSVHGISSFAEWSRIVRQVIGQKVRPSFKKYACFLEVNFIP